MPRLHDDAFRAGLTRAAGLADAKEALEAYRRGEWVADEDLDQELGR